MNKQMLVEHLDNRGNLWPNADQAAEAKADHAAENGKWTKWAQPGFEQDAEQIGIDARDMADREAAVSIDALKIAVEQRPQPAQEIDVRVQ